MNNVVQLFETPTATGEAVCGNCRHEWVAVAPVGTTQLECGNCGTHRGAFKHPFGPSVGDYGYSCNCGCSSFYISKRPKDARGMVYCAGCGVLADAWE